ncbi:MAG: hypothetical protein H0V98_04900 [Chloroflexia bacterium]|nr:hypothetical protein [Chloroflexia bacterium]
MSDWIEVALDDFVGQRSRGIIVATEPVESDGRSFELARMIKSVIVSELTAMHDLPPDEAIGRAFAAANGMLYDEGHLGSSGGFDRKVLVGATVILIDGHRCTIGHVPPGQVVLIEDGLAYAVPDLRSWMPDFANEASTVPEPLGYTSWTAPILAQTELGDGDAAMICTLTLAQAWAEELAETGLRVADLAGYHGRSPDHALDVFRGLLISQGIEDGSALVLAFPPRPGSFGVVTMGDVGWKLRERRRRAQAQVRRLMPSRVRSLISVGPGSAPEAPTFEEFDDGTDGSSGHVSPDQPERRSRWTGASSRFRRERDMTETWNVPNQTREYGMARTHGVQLHRGVSADRADSRWRNGLPRLPFGGAVFGSVLVLLVALIGVGIWALLPRFEEPPTDVTATLNQVDEYIVTAEDTSDPGGIRQLLDLAQETLDGAEADGALEDSVAPRQAAITSAQDELDNVIRLDGLTRVGSLPEELQGSETRALYTQGGLFLVNGSLFQLRAQELEIVRVLSEDEAVGDVEVGNLFGMALDTSGFYVTDGMHVFTLQPEASWNAIGLADINDLGAWEPGPVGAFGGSLYILEQDFRNIYRFDTETGDGVAEPNDWVLAPVRPDLVNAVDMAIDGSIHVLLESGEILTYLQGDLETRQDTPFIESGEPQSILVGSGTQLLYVAMQDGEDGWIVVLDPGSGNAWQLRLPADFSTEETGVSAPFAGLQDVAIDESSGTLFLVNEDAVWTAQYSLPAEAQAGGTPTPEPDVDGG